MAESNKKGMISGMESLLTISGEEFLEVIRMETDGSFKNYRLLVSKIRNNAGLSAYEIAVQNGFVGTVDQWLSSLEGKTAYQIAVDLGFVGDEAAFIASLKGTEGEVGKSIYDIAIDNGFVGTEADFLNTLVGKSAYQTWLGLPGNAGKTEAQFIASIKGTKGDTGIQGIQGEDGRSAFEVWQALPGNIGKPESEYLEALEGDAGASAFEIALDNGFVGTEAQWLTSIEGKNAYQVAVAGGFVGNQAAWLASLKGDSAYQVAVTGGFVGTQAQWLTSLVGKSAFQSWKDAGNAGTEAQFLASLEGSDGASAYETYKALPGNSAKTQAEFIASLKGVKGDDGVDGIDGTDGVNGLSAYETYKALPGNSAKTEAEFIASLKGVKGTDGTNGTNGTNGKSAYQVAVDDGFVGSVDLWLESLVGQDGAIGAGVNVIATVTPQEYADIVAADTSAIGDAYIVETFLYIYNGTDWVKSNSIQGPEGQGLNYLGEWPTGISLPMDVNYVSGDTYVWRNSLWTLVEAPTRKWVDIGVPGPQGDSAYETYLLLPGNAGKTEAEFIASLKGPRGNDGTNGTDGADGQDGAKGDDGDSAYQVAVRDGFVGTEIQWLASLKGDQGEQGVPALAFEIKGTLANVSELPRPGNPAEAYYVVKDLYIWIVDDVTPANSDYQNFGSLNGASAYDIAVEQGFVGTKPQWLATLKGTDGVDGTDGTNGTNGTDGRNLQVKGTQANLAAIQALVAPVDQDAWVALDTGHLHIRVGAAWVDAGPFRGADGTDGVDGTDGADGKSAYETYKGLPGNSAKTEAEFIASIKGVDGTNGTNGTNGRNVTVKGSVANQAALPGGAAEQDAYTTLDTGTLFMWITGAWVNLGVFRGPKGEDGTQGVVGNDGAPGIGINIKGEVATLGDLPDPTTLEPGDAYYVIAVNKLFQVNDAYLYGPGITIVGPQGADGIQGIQGPAGTSISIMGSYATEAALKAAHPTGTAGQGYLVGNDLYLYGINPVGGATEWFNAGPVRGPKGDTGLQGIQGLRGLQGLVGERGALWLTLPNGVEEPTSGYGREGDWAVSADFNTFYKAPGTGWVQIGRLVAGDVNSPLGSLGKVVRLGTSWVALPVDEVPNLAAGKIYARQSKAGSTTEGEWVEVVFPDSFDEAPDDAKLYVRTRSVGVQDGSWFELPKGITDLVSKDSKQYIRTFEAADSAPKWKEVVIPSGLPEAPTTAGVAFARRGDNNTWVAAAPEVTGAAGTTFGRKGDKTWVAVPPEAPTTAGKFYMRRGDTAAWVEYVAPTGGLAEAPTTAGKTYLRSGQNTNWVEFTDTPTDTNLYLRKGDKTWVQYTAPAAGIAEAPNDGKQYVRKSQAWVSFDRYDTPIKAITTTDTLNPLVDQFFTVANASGAKTLTINAGPASRAMTLVLVVSGAGGTLTFVPGAGAGAAIKWNTGSPPVFTGVKTVLTLLWDGAEWIGAQGAVVPT